MAQRTFSSLPHRKLAVKSQVVSPIAHLNSFRGFVKAYWVSARWREAWGFTLGVALLICATSQSHVWIAQTAGAFMGALAELPRTGPGFQVTEIARFAGLLLGLAALQHLAILPAKKLILEHLHRRWRGWLNAQFNAAMMGNGQAYLHLGFRADGRLSAIAPMPENVDQRWQDSVKAATGGLIGLAHGAVSVVTSAVFVTLALMQTSAPVAGLEFLGNHATLVLTLLAALAFVPINTFIAWKMGRWLEMVTNRIEEAESSYRGELNGLMRFGFHIAASGAANIQARINARLYVDVDRAWSRQIEANTAYSAFSGLYLALMQRIVGYLPFLPAYAQGNLSFRNFITGSELFTSFVNDCSWLITVMPAISSLKAHYGRVADLVRAVERVQDGQRFYAETGVSAFIRTTHPAMLGLTLRDLELRHQGRETPPFLRARLLQFRPGQWVLVRGVSGCGKSSLLKAICGLWPHGAGEVALPEQAAILYACQDIRLPRTSLKQLVAIPRDANAFRDAEIATVLVKAGLGQFAERLHAEELQGRRWEDALSGGQKQQLILARILLHRPDILLLDEATCALDPAAKLRFHELAQSYCPQAVVLSVMHDGAPPLRADGSAFYDSTLHVAHGRATLEIAAGRPGARRTRPVFGAPLS